MGNQIKSITFLLAFSLFIFPGCESNVMTDQGGGDKDTQETLSSSSENGSENLKNLKAT